jgi:tetratricopeptide (TPR) repeat protein
MRRALFIFFALLASRGHAETAKGQIAQFLRENRLDEGVAICRQVELLAAYDRDTAFNCAWVYFRKDLGPSAEKILDRFKAFSHTPEYQVLAAQDYINHKQYEKAKVILDTIRRENPKKPVGETAELLNAEVYEKRDPKGGLSTAGFLYKQLENSSVDKGRVAWGLGRYYAAQGDYRRATQYLEQTAKLWPTHAESRKQLGAIYLNQSSPEAAQYAAKWLGEAYKMNKADAGVLEQLGVLFEKRGLKAEAIKKWQAAIEINKDSKIAKEKLTQYFAEVVDDLIAARKFDAALKKMDSAPKSVTSDAKYSLRRGLARRGLGQWEKAVGDLQAYVAASPKDAMALRELGICYVNLNLIDQAITFFAKAASEAPDDGMNYAWLAWSLEGKGEWKQARDTWRKALELLKDPKELEKATRKLANIERKIRERDAEKQH